MVGWLCSTTDGGPGIFSKWFPRFHPVCWHPAGRQGKNEHRGSRRKVLWARPRSGKFSSPHIPFLSVLKTEQSTRRLTTENPNHFSFISLTLTFSHFLLPKFSSRSSLCISAVLYTHPVISVSHFLTLLKVISDLLILRLQSSQFPFDSPSLHPFSSFRSYSQCVI